MLRGMPLARKVRPLGYARSSLGSPDRIKFPPLQSPVQQIPGVHGNAMNIPPPKINVDRIIPSRARSETLADQSEHLVKEKERQIKEVLSREGQLKKQIIMLHKQIQETKTELAERDDMIQQCQAQTEEAHKQETYWKEKYFAEVDLHKSTKNNLKNEQQRREDLQVAMETQKAHHEKLMQMHEQEFADMENKKNKEIEERDEKLKRLKMQIADALQGNSWERQQQIDELGKELQRTQEEAEALRIKLKMLSRNTSDKENTITCQKCQDLSAKIKDLERELKEKYSYGK